MVSFKNVLVLATAALAATILPREDAVTLANLGYINGNTTALYNAANTYNGGVINSVPVASAENKLETAVNNTTPIVSAHAAYSSSEAAAIIKYINGTIEPNIVKTVNEIIAKKSKFAADGLSSTVLSDFKKLKAGTDSLGAALIKKAPSSYVSSAKSVQAKIDADLQKGINAFS